MSVYAFDGTWNEAKDGDDPGYTNTNVFRFYNAYKRHSKRPDLDFYVPGVGTRFKAIGRALGGVFGLGELSRINEAYEALCKAWDKGERDIDIVGFSRGAATTLDFCHKIQERGIRKPGSLCTTSAMRGIFRENASTRNELLSLVFGNGGR